jgi:hypothetical protein
MAPGKMIKLEIGGQPVTVTVEREQLEDDLAARGYPADRNVYVTTWNDHQIDDTDWSDDGSLPRAMAEAARDLGHEWVALTDRSPRLIIRYAQWGQRDLRCGAG